MCVFVCAHAHVHVHTRVCGSHNPYKIEICTWNFDSSFGIIGCDIPNIDKISVNGVRSWDFSPQNDDWLASYPNGHSNHWHHTLPAMVSINCMLSEVCTEAKEIVEHSAYNKTNTVRSLWCATWGSWCTLVIYSSVLVCQVANRQTGCRLLHEHYGSLWYDKHVATMQ